MKKKHVYPASQAWMIDNRVRKWIQNPGKILSLYIKKGMVVLDIGCGSGFYTREIAELVGKKGKVIAVDLQQKMLDKLKRSIKGKEIKKRIKLVKCSEDDLKVNEKVNLVFALYVVHEILNEENLFKQIKKIMKKSAKFILIEPKLEISEKDFENTIDKAKKAGFKIIGNGPKVFFSRSVLLGV